MYWLRKIILTRMEDDDIDKHIEGLLSAFDKLKSLVTADNPLTPDDVLTTALFISLPSEWTPVVAPLMQRASVKSTDVIRALRAESNRKKSSMLHEQNDVSAAKTSTTSVEKKHCSHCDRDGHTLLECYTAAGILKRHKQDSKRNRNRNRNSTSHNKTKAGKTSIVTLGKKSDDSESSSEENNKTSAKAVRLEETNALSVRGKSTDWLVDSGCGKVMSPHNDHVTEKSNDQTRVHLADNSTISASKSGFAALPFETPSKIPALQVPDLHEPLLSVAGVCDSGLEILLTKRGCTFYKKGTLRTSSDSVAAGERRGDLYILPSKVNESHTHPLRCLKAKADDSLLAWHTRLGHVGIKPLRIFLTQANIHPSVSNSIEVQQCDVCTRGKLH